MKSIERCEYFEFYWIDESIAKYILYIYIYKKKLCEKSIFKSTLQVKIIFKFRN